MSRVVSPSLEPPVHALRTGRVARDRVFVIICIGVTLISAIVLTTLLVSIGVQGAKYLDWEFLRNYPSRLPAKAGFKGALWGSLWLCAICAIVALPLGIGAAVYLEEFAPRNRLTAFIKLNISNLAGVPSIVYGIIGLTAFTYMFGLFGTPTNPSFELGSPESWYYIRLPFGGCVLTGGLTLMIVVLSIVIIASQEALRAVPDSLREGALATGATRWQMVSRMTLPAALPCIMTGVILSMSRAIGEAAPLLVVGGFLFVTFTPRNTMDDFAAMPLQIYNWASRPQAEFAKVAASGIIVLLAILLTFNAAAVLIRQVFQKPLQ
jgi:phosphate transport system permease protein